MKKPTLYAKVAIKAAKLGGNPVDSWEKAVNTVIETPSSRNKCCPKNAFLGLCEEGMVKGIKGGEYTKSRKNKDYALKAINILKKNKGNPITTKALWEAIKPSAKNQNGQMDVVLTLWENKLIN